MDGAIYRILEFQHVKPGKGGAFVRTKLRRLDDGARDRQDVPGRREVPPGAHRDAEDAVPLRLGRRGGVHGHAATTSSSSSRASLAGDAMQWVSRTTRSTSSSSTSGRPRSRSRARSTWPSTKTDPGLQGRHGVRRRHQAGDARVRGASRRAAVHQRGRPGARRHPLRRVRLPGLGHDARSDQRRDAVFAALPARRHRPPARRAARPAPSRSPASWPRRSRRTVTTSTPRSIVTRAAGRSTGIAPLERSIMRVALYELRHRDDIPVEVAIDEAVRVREGVLRRRRAGVRQRHPGRGRWRGRQSVSDVDVEQASPSGCVRSPSGCATRSCPTPEAEALAREAADLLARASAELERTAARAARRQPGDVDYPDELRALVEDYLEGLRFSSAAATAGLDEAMRYSLLAGGKRIRPVLCLATARSIRDRAALGAARRGGDRADPHLFADPRRPAGDGRRRAAPRAPDLARRLRRERRDPGRRRPLRRGDPPLRERQEGDPERVLAALAELVRATGVGGMVGGQYVDVDAPPRRSDADAPARRSHAAEDRAPDRGQRRRCR